MRYAVFGPSFVSKVIYDDYPYVKKCLDQVSDLTGVISGGSKGVETMAQRWAEQHDKPLNTIRPIMSDAATIGNAQVFVLRNNRILTEMDAMVLFWDGGFSDTLRLQTAALLLKKKVIVFPV